MLKNIEAPKLHLINQNQRIPAEKRDEGTAGRLEIHLGRADHPRTVQEVVWKPLEELSSQASKKTGRN